MGLPGFITATSLRVPAGSSGVSTMIFVELTTVTEIGGTPPILTAAPA